MRKNLLIIISLFFLIGCSKDETESNNESENLTLPSITLVEIFNVTSNTAEVRAAISNDGGANVTARGIVWGTSSNPTQENSVINNGSGDGEYTASVQGLNSGWI